MTRANNQPDRQGRLAGDVAIVTGSTSGLGKEIARLFAREGASVVVTGRNVERGTAMAQALVDEGGTALFVPADLGIEADAHALVDRTIDHYGGLHILVSNAVAPEIIARDSKAADVPTDIWEAMLRVNVIGAAWLL
jgi:3-oxoacyl-[acyl-carrier protein] reductase